MDLMSALVLHDWIRSVQPPTCRQVGVNSRYANYFLRKQVA